MKSAIALVAVSACLLGCAATPTPEPRDCGPLPKLREGASLLERRIHTEHIVRLYVRCAGAGE